MTNDKETIIQTDKLTRDFGQITAVDQLDLEVKAGEIFGLVGPDGAGKTTTIRMLATVMRPSDGRATVAGFDAVKEAEAIKARIGYMAQEFSLYGDLSVAENLAFFADVFDVRGETRRQRTQRLLEFARLTDFTGRHAAQLSGGMQKKLALTCALIHQPDILLLDEPTNGVDPVSRREFWEILMDLRLQGVTILVSTPYMDEAERCSRVGLIYQGRLIAVDTPEKIKAQIKEELIELRPTGEKQDMGLMKEAEAAVTDLEGVSEVQTYGDLLHILVDDAQQRMPQVEEALAERSIRAEGMRQTQARMEEVFISLMRQQQTGPHQQTTTEKEAA